MELSDLFNEELRRYLINVTKKYFIYYSDDNAQDLVHNAMLRGMEKIHLFDGVNFKGWMLRILRNTYINEYRREQRCPIQPAIDFEAIEWMYNSEIDLDSNIDLHYIADTLPENFKGVILLDAEGHDMKEIADRLNIPVGTVLSRLHRARKFLNKRYKTYKLKASYETA